MGRGEVSEDGIIDMMILPIQGLGIFDDLSSIDGKVSLNFKQRRKKKSAEFVPQEPQIPTPIMVANCCYQAKNRRWTDQIQAGSIRSLIQRNRQSFAHSGSIMQKWTLAQVAVESKKLSVVCSQTGLRARRTKESSALMTSTSLTSPAINHHHHHPPNPAQRQHIKSCLLPLKNFASSSQNTINSQPTQPPNTQFHPQSLPSKL